ncbi:hypothetical protein chiPu_0002568 [Chiloscyllium punctatum]|uniref:Uncharacterized protein n=1 Tax=Chiloscyllium punctatum TaxID=137246 RepID=A0A401S1B7_CHIPU|nr:hypothetical protein [Chiloscyllium punctatum]
MPKGKGASKQQQGGHSPAVPATPETAAAASPEPPGDLTDSQELAAAMERLTLKVAAAIDEIRGEIHAQVQPIALMLQKHKQKIQGLRERLEEVGGQTKASETAMESPPSRIQVLEREIFFSSQSLLFCPPFPLFLDVYLFSSVSLVLYHVEHFECKEGACKQDVLEKFPRDM